MKSESETTESSVQVRLAEIMGLEQERVAEAEAKERREEAQRQQEARGAEAKRRREEETLQHAEEARRRATEQARRDAAAKRELERETALHRIRLESEVREEAKRQEMLWRHEAALQQMRPQSRGGTGWRRATAAIAAAVVAGIVLYASVVHPSLIATATAAPRRAAAAAQTEALAYENQNATLREEVARLEAVVVQLRTPANDNSLGGSSGNGGGEDEIATTRNPRGRPVPRPMNARPASPLDALDFDSTDPLTGL